AGSWTDATAHGWVGEWAARTPDAPAAIGPDSVMTYGQLHEAARRFASGLLAAGFRRGDAIGVQLPNTPDFLTVFLGIQTMGAVPCMLPMPYRLKELEPLLTHGRAKGVVCLSGLENYDVGATMAELRAALPDLETVIDLGDAPPSGSLSFAELANAEIVPIADPPDADDPAVLAFTSGTSAAPKAIVHAHRTLSAACGALGENIVTDARDVVMCGPAYTHAFGLLVLVATIAAGAASATMGFYSPNTLAETIRRTRATVFCGGPVHVFLGRKAGLWTPDVTASLKRSFIGGAPTPDEAVRIMDEASPNGRAYQIWGMSEVLVPIMNAVEAPAPLRFATVGTAWKGHEARVVGDDGALLPPDEEGHLETRGPFQIASYYGNAKATAEAFRADGWYRTGDLARLDRDGHVFMSGRAKDLIIRGGVKINPVDVELAMDAHPAVAQSAIVPYPDPVLGERACLVLAMTPGEILTLDAVRAYLDGLGIAKLRWPERLEFVEAMPMTASRKIVKGRLIEQLGLG
ncbi:MAG: acyl--CoA ligase, partial [Rhodospirillaceae bacterium]|nr:acyl--CoA ligase [Rhodospirillaceae bacterium]